jgi:fumarylacetoacetate (FAA) hydrolase
MGNGKPMVAVVFHNTAAMQLTPPLDYDGTFTTMLDFIRAGETVRDETYARAKMSQTGFILTRARFHAPLTNPTSLRDFYAFEQHVKTANANRGREVPKEWYDFPVFYFSNHTAIYGHSDTIPYPRSSDALDYELEIACIIGKEGRDIAPEHAEEYVFGYTIFNDWSARDIQRQEMAVGLGPAKGKDFAASFGPHLVTPDELADKRTDRPGVYDLSMVARVNGVEKSRGNWKDLHWSFGQMIARASEDVTLYPGDIIGSGTVGTGCLLEVTKGEGPWLKPGDIVELEVEKLGVLRNVIGEKKVIEKPAATAPATVTVTEKVEHRDAEDAEKPVE